MRHIVADKPNVHLTKILQILYRQGLPVFFPQKGLASMSGRIGFLGVRICAHENSPSPPTHDRVAHHCCPAGNDVVGSGASAHRDQAGFTLE
jgi:hypothetical protein